jgi:hypothetical protein
VAQLFAGEIFADYHQFYVQDEQADCDLSDAWTDEAIDDMLAVVPGCLGVGTVRNVSVPVELELAHGEPDDGFESFDQVVDASIDVPSGTLVIGCITFYFPDADRVGVPPGTYRVRIFYSGLDTISEDGLEGSDRYRLVLWPGEMVEKHVLKRAEWSRARP